MKKIVVASILLFTMLVLSSCNGVEDIPVEDTIPFDPSNPTEVDPTYLQYSTFSTENALLTNIPVGDGFMVTDIVGNEIASDDVITVGDYYEINSDYIINLDRDIVQFYFYYETSKTLIHINVNDKESPYMISSTIVTTDGTRDLVYQFDLFDATFTELTGETVTEDDYTVEGNLLTINQSFIDSEFTTENTITLNYHLESDSLVVGLIQINKD